VVFAILPVLAAWNSGPSLFAVIVLLMAGFLVDRYLELPRYIYIFIRIIGWAPVFYVFASIYYWDKPILLMLANVLLCWVILYSFEASRRGYIMVMNMMAGMILLMTSLMNRDLVFLLGLLVYVGLFIPASAEAVCSVIARRHRAKTVATGWFNSLMVALTGIVIVAAASGFIFLFMLFAPRYIVESLSFIGRYNVYQTSLQNFRVGLGGRPLDRRLLMEVKTEAPGNYRGQIFARFGGVVWKQDPMTADQRDMFPLSQPNSYRIPPGPGEVWNGATRGVVQLITISDNLSTDLRYGQLRTAAIVTDGEKLRVSSNGIITGRPRRDFSYQVISRVPQRGRGSNEATTLDRLRQVEYLQLPENLSERVRDLTRRITRRRYNDEAKVLALIDHLKNNYRYDLNVTTPPYTRDIVDFFLFRSRAGYCEHFATALTVMCRMADIPARLVTGFAQGEYNPETGNYDVRALHAHAWTEVFIEGRGWYTYDATPAAAFDIDGSFGGNAGTGALGEWGNKLFNFIDSDQNQARKLTIDALQLPLIYSAFRDAGPGMGPQLVVTVVLLVVLMVVMFVFWLRRRREQLRRAQAASADELVELYGTLRCAIAAAGLPDSADQTPREFADKIPSDTLSPSWNEIGAGLGRVTGDYYRYRFGRSDNRQSISLQLRDQLQNLVDMVERLAENDDKIG